MRLCQWSRLCHWRPGFGNICCASSVDSLYRKHLLNYKERHPHVQVQVGRLKERKKRPQGSISTLCGRTRGSVDTLGQRRRFRSPRHDDLSSARVEATHKLFASLRLGADGLYGLHLKRHWISHAMQPSASSIRLRPPLIRQQATNNGSPLRHPR